MKIQPLRAGLLAAPIALVAMAAGCANTIERSIVVGAPIDEAWEVIGERFAEVDSWASAVPSSSPTYADGELIGRTCDTTLGSVSESIQEFDAENHTVSYSAEAAEMPFFVRGLTNRWTLTAEGPNATRVDMRFEADLWPGFNLAMWPFMRGQFTDLLDSALEEYQYYLEAGEPHPRKLEAQLAEN